MSGESSDELPGSADAPIRVDELDRLLRSIGVPDAEVDAAREAGLLALLAVERLVVPELEYDIDEASRRTGIETERLLQMWGALGFAMPNPGEPAFSAADIGHLQQVAHLLGVNGPEPEVIFQLTRTLGASMARVAAIQVDIIAALGGTESDGPTEIEALWFGDTFAGIMAEVWRRHLQGAARTRLAADAPPGATAVGERTADGAGTSEGADVAGGRVVAVGFADLVGFTALSQQLDSASLAQVVDRFENVAYTTVARHGGRVVKMIGDEVMFAIDDPVAAAHCALDLAESYHEAHDLSDVRVGVALGAVVDREGDLFGPAVNLASRMTAIALPGTVLVDEALRASLGEDSEFVFRSMLPRRLKHIGLARLHVLRRGEDDVRRPSRRDRRRARVAELTSGLLEGASEDPETPADRSPGSAEADGSFADRDEGEN